jgi:chromosome partitioning protein
MKTIAIYNNKGGVGKSTLTLFAADFLASLPVQDRQSKILVMDLDGQGSSATALLGIERVQRARDQGRSLSHYVLEKAKQPNAELQLTDYIAVRERGKTALRQIPLGPLSVMVPDKAAMLAFEDKYRGPKSCLWVTKLLRKQLRDYFDFVLLDLPANIDRRNTLSMAGLAFADHIVIPIEPSRLTMNAMNDTLTLIHDARELVKGYKRQPQIVGLALNKTDRRTQQYKRHKDWFFQTAEANNTVVFEHFLPNHPRLSTAADDSMDFATLRERYDKYYDNVRKLTLELAERCGVVINRRRRKQG